MKRDMNLIRLVLLDAECEEEVDLCLYTDEEIGYHSWLAWDAGLAISTGSIRGHTDRHEQAIIIGLTWEGHDFLDAARDPTTWNATQKSITEKVGTVTFDLLKALLIAAAKDQLGL